MVFFSLILFSLRSAQDPNLATLLSQDQVIDSQINNHNFLSYQSVSEMINCIGKEINNCISAPSGEIAQVLTQTLQKVKNYSYEDIGRKKLAELKDENSEEVDIDQYYNRNDGQPTYSGTRRNIGQILVRMTNTKKIITNTYAEILGQYILLKKYYESNPGREEEFKKIQKQHDKLSKRLGILANDLRLIGNNNILYGEEAKNRQDEAINKNLGRIYWVMKFPGDQPCYQVLSSSSGVVVKTNETTVILTCAHLEYDSSKVPQTNELEIYFLPNSELDQDTFLPMETQNGIIEFDKYQGYKIQKILYERGAKLYFLPSTITPDNSLDISTHPLVREEKIKKLRKLKEEEDKDIALMVISNKGQLTTGLDLWEGIDEEVPADKASKNLGWIEGCKGYAAGYPGYGFSADTLAISETLNSTAISEITSILKQIRTTQADKISSNFPCLNGMSGGPVFTKEEDKIQVRGVVRGIDLEYGDTLFSSTNKDHIDNRSHNLVNEQE